MTDDLLRGFTPIQRRWVIARVLARSDAQAAREVGVHKSTVSEWPNKEQIDAAVDAMLEKPLEQARAIMEDAIPEAARVKIAGLKSRNEFVRQGAATDLLDRGLGKPMQPVHQEIAGTVKIIAIGGINPAEDI